MGSNIGKHWFVIGEKDTIAVEDHSHLQSCIICKKKIHDGEKRVVVRRGVGLILGDVLAGYHFCIHCFTRLRMEGKIKRK